MPTLAELKAQSGPRPLPQKTVTVTLVEGQHLLAEFEALAQEAIDLDREKTRTTEKLKGENADGEQTGAPRKSGDGADLVRRLEEIETRLHEIEERVKALPDDLRQYQGDLMLTGFSGGDWQRFKDDNPPREDNDQDRVLAAGHCNASALFAALGKFVKAWDGEPVTAADWDEWLGERIAYADRRDLIPEVVKMYEGKAATLPKSRSGSPTTPSSASA